MMNEEWIERRMKANKEENEYLRQWSNHLINKDESLSELQKQIKKARVAILARAEELDW